MIYDTESSEKIANFFGKNEFTDSLQFSKYTSIVYNTSTVTKQATILVFCIYDFAMRIGATVAVCGA